jgi:hypothetical protein
MCPSDHRGSVVYQACAARPPGAQEIAIHQGDHGELDLLGHTASHSPMLVQLHANAVDTLLESDGVHHLVRRLAVVVEHGMPSRADS